MDKGLNMIAENIHAYNKKKMNGSNSVFDIEYSLLIESYERNRNVRKVFEEFKINYTSRQIINFAQLRSEMGYVEKKTIFNFLEKDLINLINEKKIHCLNLTDLIMEIGVYKSNGRKSISSKCRNQVLVFCEKNKIDLSHFKNDKIYKKYDYKQGPKYSDTEIFCIDSPASQQTIKKRFLKTVEYKCSLCGIIEWNGKELKMDMDHIDGNPRNNTIQNLRLLCPNCHSQTNTFSGKNRKNH